MRGRKPKTTTEGKTVNPAPTTDCKETCITHVHGDKFCYFFCGETWSKNLGKKMLQEHPDETELMYTNDDGSFGIKIPIKCFKKVKFPHTRKKNEENIEAVEEDEDVEEDDSEDED